MFRTLLKLLDRKPQSRPWSRRPRLSVEALEDRCLLSAVRTLPGFEANTLPANDDSSTGAVSIGFTVNFGGTFSSLHVNNNGNVTFNQASSQYTPSNLTTVTAPRIAPFWADVDTRQGAVVTYGTDVVDGHAAFGVNWVDVGYLRTDSASFPSDGLSAATASRR